MIRTLVAEDSTTCRQVLVEILRSDPEIAVAGEAADGVEAVEMTKRLRPDVVTMDIRMPRLDGFEATKQIMIEVPTPIVIVSGSFDLHDVEVSMRTLRAGALAVAPKPLGLGASDFEKESRQFLATVKAMSQVKVVRHWRERPVSRPVAPAQPRRGGVRAEIVCVAASTGGPAALQKVLSELPGDFAAPLLVVQHIARGFVAGLAAWLNGECSLKVKVAEHGEALAPRTVYLAPDDCHLGVLGRDRALLSSAAPVGGFRPSASFLFESAARAFGASVAAVFLTGMGQDGVEGARAVREAGGRIVAQDEATSVVFGMPRAAIEAGLADLVLPLPAIASHLLEAVGNGKEGT